MIFVDAGAWIGLFNEDDQFHKKAMARWRKLTKSSPPLVTSNFVFGETMTFLARQCSYDYAVRQGRRILGLPGLTLLRPAEQEELTALDLMTKWADQEIGFVDCLSFALMRRYRIKVAFTFDRHFDLAGFEIFQSVR